jgi:hypothetical protein
MGGIMRSIFLCLASLFIVLTSVAQTGSDHFKTTALQFSFNGLNLGTINAGVGGKIWTSESTTLTLSLAGTHSFDASDPNPMQTGTNVTYTAFQVQFGTEWHFNQTDSFSPFVAGGIFGRFERRHSEYTYPQNPTEEMVSSSTNVGLCFGLGAEYWLSKRLSLSGEHLFQVSYAKGTQEYTRTTNSSQVTRGFDLGLGTSSLILTLYF